MNSQTSETSARPALPWGLVLTQGILSILVGGLVLSKPGVAMIVLVRILGWYWLIKGIFSIALLFNKESRAHWGRLLFSGVIGILAGFAVLDHPLLSAIFVPSVLTTFIGIAGIFIGVSEIMAFIRGGGAGMAVLGLVSVLLGGTLIGNPIIGVAAMPFVIGITELTGGLAAIVLAFKLRAAH